MTSNGVGSYLESMFGLRGSVALVSGGTSGLGAASARALAMAGATVILVGRDRGRGEEVVAEIEQAGGQAELELADVADSDEVRGLAERCHARHPGIDALVCCAGIFIGKPALETSQGEWESTFATNVTGTFLLCQEFGRGMISRGKGKIVTFSSTDAFVGVPEQVAYCASKGAVLQITRTLGAEWIKHGVNVNGIAPTEFATPMIEDLVGDESYLKWVKEAIPAGRVGQPHELAGAVLYLCSSASDMVVGHTLVVDGGRTAI